MKPKLITKDFVLLFLVSIAICTGMNMLNVTVPLYVTQDLGGSVGTAGLMSTLYTIAACASRPVSGILTDRLGRRAVMVIGSVLFGAACLFCGLIPAIVCMALCRVLMGVGYAGVSTANNTASTDIIPPQRMSEGVGYFGMSQSVAGAMGPAIAAWAIAAVGNRSSLWGTAIFAAVAAGLSLVVVYEKKPGYQKPQAEERRGTAFEKTAMLPSLYQGLYLLLGSCLMCFMTLYIVETRGYSSTVAGNFFLLSSVIIVLIRVALSRFIGRIGTGLFLLPGFLAQIAACIALPFADSEAAFMGIALLFGCAHGIIWMVLGSEAVRLAPPERRSAANATFYFAFDAAIGIGAAIWGQVIDHIGFASCFTIVGCLTAVVALSALPAFWKRDRITPEESGGNAPGSLEAAGKGAQ